MKNKMSNVSWWKQSIGGLEIYQKKNSFCFDFECNTKFGRKATDCGKLIWTKKTDLNKSRILGELFTYAHKKVLHYFLEFYIFYFGINKSYIRRRFGINKLDLKKRLEKNTFLPIYKTRKVINSLFITILFQFICLLFDGQFWL